MPIRVSSRKIASSVSNRLAYRVVLAHAHQPATSTAAKRTPPVIVSSLIRTSAHPATNSTNARSKKSSSRVADRFVS
jgi:hypothetical protein